MNGTAVIPAVTTMDGKPAGGKTGNSVESPHCGRAILALIRVAIHGQDARATFPHFCEGAQLAALWQGHLALIRVAIHGQDARATFPHFREGAQLASAPSPAGRGLG